MLKIRKIELLAPAKNLECGIEAIKHGADAVYIGSPRFGARAAASNTLEDIKTLCEYAHQFSAKVYIALNTILNDADLEETEELIWQLHKAGADALIIQDMGITQLDLPPIPLHASTQIDNRNIEKVKFLENAGFRQIVLARELSLDDISKISSQVTTPLEVFVHGSLCVCYSGQCYLSQAIAGRSANKGTCAQYCRLPYKLVDGEAKEVIAKKHLLSMKDLNLSEDLEALLDAGVSSLKIEGRLKDVDYVKNTVAYYRKKLDAILSRREEYTRASSGHSIYTFEPCLEKSFNRGYTKYFLHGRASDIWSLDSPKSIGEPIGVVSEVTTRFFEINSNKQINNGDGLCYFNNKKELEGIHVNRVDKKQIFPLTMPEMIKKGTFIYRNHNHEFEKLLSKNSAERKINVAIDLNETAAGYSLQITDENGNCAVLNVEQSKELANKDQSDNIRNNLSKTGNTIFNVTVVNNNLTANWFIPSSVISEWRRQLTDNLLSIRKTEYKQDIAPFKQTEHAFPIQNITYLGNVMNDKSRQFYVQHKSEVSQVAFEKESQEDVPLMFTRHCIKHALGWCPKETSEKFPYKEPFYLRYNDTRLRLSFDCKECEMKVYRV